MFLVGESFPPGRSRKKTRLRHTPIYGGSPRNAPRKAAVALVSGKFIIHPAQKNPVVRTKSGTCCYKATAHNKQSKHRAEDRPRPTAHGLFEAPSPSSPKRAGGVMSLSGHVLRLSNVGVHVARARKRKRRDARHEKEKRG
jgi:hypothetical protein